MKTQPLNFSKIRNISILEDFLNSYYEEKGLFITFFDKNYAHIEEPRGKREFCLLMKNTELGPLCEKSNNTGCERCRSEKKAVAQQCHAGLIDIFVPVKDNDEIIGYLVTGQILKDDGNVEINPIVEDMISKRDEGFQNRIKRAFLEIPKIKQSEIDKIKEKLEYHVNYYIKAERDVLEDDDLQSANMYIEKVKRLKKYLKLHCGEDITLEALSKEFAMNPFSLGRKFKEIEGMTIFKYIKEQRLVKAEQYLKKNKKMQISEVAMDCGYNSPSHFIKDFRQKYGITPQVFKEIN